MHWHGFGPWIGSGEEYGREGKRRPALGEQMDVFLMSRLPTMQTGHALLRAGHVAGTWTDAASAVDWLCGLHDTHPPMQRTDGGRTYLPVTDKALYALDALPRGTDVVWAYWTGSRLLASYSVVCCAHRDHPDIPCPDARRSTPPATTAPAGR